MSNLENLDWIDNYGFILVAFAHMTDWHLADAEMTVINEKLQLMLSQSKQEYSKEEASQKLDKILNRYEILKDDGEKKMMENLLLACESLMNESWFDNLSATVVIRFLAEIAEADHKIEETEIQLLKNIADVFGVESPRI
jgi:uncharacterized tellurite resistance protein B-like protein